MNPNLTPREARAALARQRRNLISSQTESLRAIVAVVAEFYRLDAGQILIKSRGPLMVSWPRQVAMALCRDLTGASLMAVGRHFHRDHGTVMYAARAVAGLCSVDNRLRDELQRMRAQAQAAIRLVETT